MEREAFGELGLTPAQFYGDYDMGQYLRHREGYYRRINREWEDHWLQTRELVWLLYNVNVERKDQKSRNELLPLPSDGQHYRPTHKPVTDTHTADASKTDDPNGQRDFFAALREHVEHLNSTHCP